MTSQTNDIVEVSGVGIATPIGVGLESYKTSLQECFSNFSTIGFSNDGSETRFPVAQITDFNFAGLISNLNLPDKVIVNAKRIRNISKSTLYGIYCALNAWADAELHEIKIDRERVAIIVSGSNIQQEMLQRIQNEYRTKLQFLNPLYGLNFFDTDLVGILSELLSIKGEGHSIGAASASGNMAIIQGCRLILSKEYDLVMVAGPLMELSQYEYQGLTSLGAMAKIDQNKNPNEMARPFDHDHCGFVYGECSGCLILESHAHATSRGKRSYGSITGYGISLDSNRNPNPSIEGEKKAMLKAISSSLVPIDQIDYINTHGTGSPIGDQTEVEALMQAGLTGIRTNSTKSLTGHGLSAAGIIEAIACLIQLSSDFIHGTKNLLCPINNQIRWVTHTEKVSPIRYALSNNFGFGGINTSIILKNSNL